MVHYFLGSKIFWGQKLFWVKNFLGSNFFGQHFLGQKFFLFKIFFGSKFFLGQNFFGAQSNSQQWNFPWRGARTVSECPWRGARYYYITFFLNWYYYIRINLTVRIMCLSVKIDSIIWRTKRDLPNPSDLQNSTWSTESIWPTQLNLTYRTLL